jgi:hypothetical protein
MGRHLLPEVDEVDVAFASAMVPEAAGGHKGLRIFSISLITRSIAGSITENSGP